MCVDVFSLGVCKLLASAVFPFFFRSHACNNTINKSQFSYETEIKRFAVCLVLIWMSLSPSLLKYLKCFISIQIPSDPACINLAYICMLIPNKGCFFKFSLSEDWWQTRDGGIRKRIKGTRYRERERERSDTSQTESQTQISSSFILFTACLLFFMLRAEADVDLPARCVSCRIRAHSGNGVRWIISFVELPTCHFIFIFIHIFTVCTFEYVC